MSPVRDRRVYSVQINGKGIKGQRFNIPENKKVVIGIAFGYPDRENPVNW